MGVFLVCMCAHGGLSQTAIITSQDNLLQQCLSNFRTLSAERKPLFPGAFDRQSVLSPRGQHVYQKTGNIWEIK